MTLILNNTFYLFSHSNAFSLIQFYLGNAVLKNIFIVLKCH